MTSRSHFFNAMLSKGDKYEKTNDYINHWVSGGLKTIYVTDSINPNAPQTKMNYDFVLINPNAH